jgi:replicative superfamily II helicase
VGIELSLDISEQIEQLARAAEEDTDNAKALYIEAIFSKELGRPIPKIDGITEEYEKMLFGLETVGFDLVKRASLGVNGNGERRAWRELIWPAYRLRRTLEICGNGQQSYKGIIENLFSETLNGITAYRQPELRLRLSEIGGVDFYSRMQNDLRWDEHLELEVKKAFLLLTRKLNGYVDLDAAAEIINNLRKKQEEGEKSIENINDPFLKQAAAIRTLALYNCAKAVELTNDFVRGAIQSERRRRITSQGLKDEIDRFIFNAREITSGIDPLFRQQIGQLGQACHTLIDASVFSLIRTPGIRNLILDLSSRQKDKPILEFWYAQRQAIIGDLLNPAKTAIVVSLPTSSGKTLLAEMAITQAYKDEPDKRIVYLAPTRALVTQVSLTLKRDLQNQGLIVRVATPAFELNPIESDILKGDFNILVTTPEKLDLLLRRDHESVRELSLIVVDEAHNIADDERGAKLEMLLATLRRERECRYLLMTPFAKNANDLAFWLGQDQGMDIVIDWKPNDRVVGIFKRGAKLRKLSDKRKLLFETLDSMHSDCPAGVEIDITEVPEETASKESIALEATKLFATVKNGGVLLLAKSRPAAENRAGKIAEALDGVKSSRTVDIVCRFLDTEASGEHPLSALLRKGVAFHHAGLSPEARYFVERLMEDGGVKVICATTSLAQGVNFPLSTAVIEGYHRTVYKKGQPFNEELKPWEFWNIAGRVGRTLQDNLGTIAFASYGTRKDSKKRRDIDKIQEYLNKEASIVVSSLFATLEALGGRSLFISIDTVEKHRALSAFLQYLLHAIAIAGIQEVDDPMKVVRLLQSSLVFHESQKKGQVFADQLIRIANEYVQQLKQKRGLEGYVAIADGTGFSSPSVDHIWSTWRNKTQFYDWQTDRIFPSQVKEDDTLSEIMQTLGDIPEIRLGTHETGTFNPVRVARIASMWVNGVSLSEIAKREYKADILECTKHIYSAVTTLIPWGIQAIQRVSFAGDEKIDWADLDLIPAMVLHGVRTKEAIALRMLNIPRFIAEKMANTVRNESVSLNNLDQWLVETDEHIWEESLPKDAKITGPECKHLWEIIEGKKSWEI